jgi:hypothetical protein
MNTRIIFEYLFEYYSRKNYIRNYIKIFEYYSSIRKLFDNPDDRNRRVKVRTHDLILIY